MRTVLITGGAGFIGSNFVFHWAEQHRDDRIIVLDALTYAGNLASISALIDSGKIEFVHGDICDGNLAESIFTRSNIDTVIHFAAESHVDRSIAAPAEFIRTNVVGTHTLLLAALSAWKEDFDGKRFHHVSTDEVYGELELTDAAFTEETAYAPRSPYAATKASSDFLVRAYSTTYGLPVTISNCSNNYGPYQFPEKLIPLMLVNALEGKALPVYGNGSNIRDWLYVQDHCEAVASIVERGALGETYNIGGGYEVTNLELVRELCRQVDKKIVEQPVLAARYPQSAVANGGTSDSLIKFVKDRPGHDRRYAVNPAKISCELGYAPKVSFSDGLSRTIDWYLSNEHWWRAVQSGEYREWIDRHYGSGNAGKPQTTGKNAG